MRMLRHKELVTKIPTLILLFFVLTIIGPACNKGDLTLSVSAFPDEGGIVKPKNHSYAAGDRVELTAVPSPGYRFSRWIGDLNSAENPSVIIMDRDKRINAEFIKTWKLSFSCNPAGSGILNHQDGYFDDASEITLTAKALFPYVFDYWGNDQLDKNEVKITTINHDQSFTANFIELKPETPLSKTGIYSGSDVRVPILMEQGQWAEVELKINAAVHFRILKDDTDLEDECEWIARNKVRFQAMDRGSYAINITATEKPVNTNYELILTVYSNDTSSTAREVYFQSDFKKTYPSLNLDYYQEFYYPEPTPYPIEKGIWNWLSVRSADYPYSGTIRLVPDPFNLNQACAEFRLDAEGTRPLGGDQHAKVYEVQDRQAENYSETYRTFKEAWYNFKVWIPRDFEVKTWRLIWQSYGDPVPSTGTGGPQLAIYNYADDGWLFVIKRANADGAREHDYPLISSADFPKDRWVQVSIYWKQGTAWQTQDGIIRVWIDGVERLNRNDLETATESGRPYHTWGIGNYGGPAEEFGQYIRFKEVNVSNRRDLW